MTATPAATAYSNVSQHIKMRDVSCSPGEREVLGYIHRHPKAFATIESWRFSQPVRHVAVIPVRLFSLY